MTGEDLSLIGLFMSAFVSATLLPGSSEVVLTALATQSQLSPWLLLAVATAGNTLGGMSTWAVGWVISWRYQVSQLTKPEHRRAVMHIRRWGSPILLLSWVPFLGDPLCVAAGWMRIPWVRSLCFIGVGKALRYGVILSLVQPG